MSDYMDRLVDRCNFNFWGPLLIRAAATRGR
jgi:hypothetical protein